MSKERTNQDLTVDELKARVLKVKKRLPRLYIDKLVRAYPQYNTKEGKSQVYSVVGLKKADLEITLALESIAL